MWLSYIDKLAVKEVIEYITRDAKKLKKILCSLIKLGTHFLELSTGKYGEISI